MKGAESFRDKEGRVWLADFPTPGVVKSKVLNDLDWFFERITERIQVFASLRVWLKELHPKLVMVSQDPLELAKILVEYNELCSRFFPYFLLVGLVVDEIASEFRDFLIGFASEAKAIEYIDKVMRTPFAEQIVNLGKAPVIVKDFVFPASEPLLIDARVNYSPLFALDAEFFSACLSSGLDSRSRVTRRFVSYRLTVPLLIQLSDENLYLWVASQGYLSTSLEKIGAFLVARDKLKNMEDIVDRTLEEITDLVATSLLEM